ncbi:hypothetical protein [Glaciecola sp. SC05]|uniref:hypothetical protein n=1 Tax=Glaciecola sp. SC05 TaxID=1987355 RepID=UPI003528B3AD
MKTIIRLFYFIMFALWAHSASAQTTVLVVANIDSEMQLTKQQVRNLFLGGSLPENLRAVELSPKNDLRVVFNTKVVGLTEARIQSYWAQMRFSGRKKPPKQFDDKVLLIEYVLENEGSVCYLPSDHPIPEGLKVIFTAE